MDRLSIKVLKYLNKQSKPVHINTIVAKYGEESVKSLKYLAENDYISEGKRIAAIEGSVNNRTFRYKSDLTFSIESPGKDFLQHRFGNDFDRWLNRFNLIIAILGGALLSEPLWKLINWIKGLFS